MARAADNDLRDPEAAATPASPPPMRRKLFGGLRAEDVERAIELREEQLEEMRRDLAALWLAFQQQERALRELTRTVEELRGVQPGSPGAESSPSPPPQPPGKPLAQPPGQLAAPGRPEAPVPSSAAPSPPPAPAVEQGSVGRQLADLDEVLHAIERATKTLEHAYGEEIAGAPGRESSSEEQPDRSEEERSGG